jgi:hypothetical protein
MKQCIGVLHDMKYLIKEFALSLLKYIHVFLIVGISLLGITLLLSKNKLGNDCLLYKTKLGDTFFYAEEIRTGKKHLALNTLYKRK